MGRWAQRYSDIQYVAQILSLKVEYNELFLDHRTIRAQYRLGKHRKYRFSYRHVSLGGHHYIPN